MHYKGAILRGHNIFAHIKYEKRLGVIIADRILCITGRGAKLILYDRKEIC